MAKVHIGSISTGTLRSEDLLGAFAFELERLSDTYTELIDRANMAYEALNNTATADDEIDASEVVNELIDALNEYALPHTYFGAHEGDGADFGFWPTGEPIDETCEITVTHEPGYLDQNTELFDHDCNVIVQVNDHGNITVSTVVCDGENHKPNGTNLCKVGVCLVADQEIWSAV